MSAMLGTVLVFLFSAGVVLLVSIIVKNAMGKSKVVDARDLNASKMWDNARGKFERKMLEPDGAKHGMVINYLSCLFEEGAKAGCDPEKLNMMMMEIIEGRMILGVSEASVSLTYCDEPEGSIAYAVYKCFSRRELNSSTAKEAARRERKAASKFERMAWRIVMQVSEVNERL